MNAGLPDDITVRSAEGGGVCYVLPEAWGRRGWAGLADVSLGLLLWAGAATLLLVWGNRMGWWPSLIAMLAIPCGALVLAGCWLLYIGLKRAARPLGVVLAPGWLGSIYGLGPLRFRRERPLGEVLHLRVYSPGPGHDGKLVAVCRDARDLPLVWEVPCEWILELARFLEEQIAHLCRGRAGEPVRVVEEEEEVEAIQPPDSTIVVTCQAGAVQFTTPPAGLHVRMLPALVLGGLLLAGSWLLVAYFVTAMPRPPGVNLADPLPWVWLFVLVCGWLNGVWFILLPVMQGSRWGVLAVSPEGLRIVDSGLFRAAVYEWGPGEVRSVSAEGSSLWLGLADGDRFEWLGIPPPRGKVSPAETRWLASELRAALGLASGGSVPVKARNLASRGRQPPEERIRQQPPRAGGRP